jgi:hypothetical protein
MSNSDSEATDLLLSFSRSNPSHIADTLSIDITRPTHRQDTKEKAIYSFQELPKPTSFFAFPLTRLIVICITLGRCIVAYSSTAVVSLLTLQGVA